jgi:transposase-like protein
MQKETKMEKTAVVKRERTNLNESEKKLLVDQFISTSQSQAQFSRSVGIAQSTFNKWVEKYRPQKNDGQDIPSGFIPITDSAREASRIELDLPGGITLRIYTQC